MEFRSQTSQNSLPFLILRSVQWRDRDRVEIVTLSALIHPPGLRYLT